MTTSFSANDQRGAQQINLDDIPILTDLDIPEFHIKADPLYDLASMLVDSVPDEEIEAMIAEEDERIVREAIRAVRKMYNRRKKQRRARTGRK